MNNTTIQTINQNEQETELNIDVKWILGLLWRHIVMILVVGIICASAAFFYARMFITPTYEASVLYYVNGSSISLSNSFRISTSEASGLINTYVAILRSRANLEQVIEESGVNYSYEQMRSMVSARAVNSTGLFQVAVRSTNPEEARNLANIIATLLPDRISDIMIDRSVMVVDYAVTPKTRVSPNYISYAERGLLGGALISAIIILLMGFLDDEIHSEDYLTQNYNAPVLAVIPELTARGAKKYGYGYGSGYGYGYGYENAGAQKNAGKKADAGKEKADG